MTAQYIPTPGTETPHLTQFTTLDGVRYRLRFDWNARIGVWMLGIFTESGTALAPNLPMVLGAQLVSESAKRRDPRLPQGALLLHDLRPDQGLGLPSIDEVRDGGRVRLVYIPEADL